MINLIQIQTQIQKLQKQADDIKAKEFKHTVEEILSKMRAFGITTEYLRTAGSRARKSKMVAKPLRAAGKEKKASSTKVAAKFRGPNGETWSGRGLTPRWLANLVVEGKKKEDFVI